jgi:TPR repeat protein
MAHDVFISHSARDKPSADAVCARLESRGIRCWIAPRDIRPGMTWGTAIVEAIDHARVMLLVFSSHANGSPQITREVERAVNKGLVVMPVRVEDVVPSGDLEYFLGTPHWLDAITEPFAQHLDYIADSAKFWLERIQSDSPKPLDATPLQAPKPQPVRDEPRVAPVSAAPASPAIVGARKRSNWIVRSIAVLVIALVGTTAILSARYYRAWRLAHDRAADLVGTADRVRQAALGGDPTSQVNLGLMYETGQGVPKDYAQAMLWFRKAAEQGNGWGQGNLGNLYSHGLGVPKDDNEAVRWYTKAAEQGNPMGQYDLGVMYENGRGVPKDYGVALGWYRKAADQGYAAAENNLGWFYNQGWGVSKDYGEAMRWYRRAAEQGNTLAEANLGAMYLNGWGVPQSLPEAMRWYGRAAAHGNYGAKVKLQELQAAQ